MPSYTLTVSAADADRIAVAMGLWLGLRDASGAVRSATAAECKQALARWLQRLVHSYEIQRETEKISIVQVVIT